MQNKPGYKFHFWFCNFYISPGFCPGCLNLDRTEKRDMLDRVILLKRGGGRLDRVKRGWAGYG